MSDAMSQTTTYRNALPLNAMLFEYRLESVLGAGGFGMTYLGWDTHLEKHVAIKEYLPGEIAVRALDGSVIPANTEHDHNYKWGLDRFIQEARTLARFSHPNIVRVNRFLEANGTSYMVMDYEAGDSLSQYLKRVPMPDEATLKNIVLPILDGLQAVHQAGFLHRDIKPPNVFIRKNGTPVLLDFGAARLASGGMTKSLTAIVSPGYAPLEQYTTDGNQGPWSDIYALAGVLYRATTGESPPDAVKRIKADAVPHRLAVARTRYSERFLKAIEWGLALEEGQRPQSVGEWQESLSGRTPLSTLNRGETVTKVPAQRVSGATPTQRVSGTVSTAKTPTSDLPTQKIPPTQRITSTVAPAPGSWKWVWRGALLLALVFAVLIFLKQRAIERNASPQNIATAPASLPAPAAKPPAEDAAAPAGSSPPATPGDSLASGPMEAQRNTETGSSGDAQVPQSVKKQFATADRDGNGFLTPEEVAGRFPYIEKHFSMVDADHDGRISIDELWQLRQTQLAKRQR